ncbi:MAG: thioredoxin family protein [Bacteroidota bacterium]
MIAIQLFGITESKSLVSWEDQINEVLEELEVEYMIQIVSDLEQFIHYDLRGIPALVIGEEVLFERQLPDLEELKKVLREKIDDRLSSQNVA